MTKQPESFEELSKLDFHELCGYYCENNVNVTDEFNDQIGKINKDLKQYSKKALKEHITKMTRFLRLFENYQRVFFLQYTNSGTQAGKESIDQFIRSSEIYFSRSDTVVNQLTIAAANKESARAMQVAVGSAVLATGLALFTYLRPPEMAPGDVYAAKFKTDSIALIHSVRENDFLEKQNKQLLAEKKTSRAPLPKRAPQNHR
ncbi:MAG: hypothetical protein V4592_08330 [Bacteroidota bacterium]